MKVSILLPTLFPELAIQALETIRAGVDGVDYEVIIVSPHRIEGDNIVFVEEAPGKYGCIAAFGQAYAAATGDFVMPFTDDVRGSPNFIGKALKHLLEREKERQILSVGLNLRESGKISQFGTVFGVLYNYFPLMRRNALQQLGGFFSPEFIANWADPDLGLRVWQAGGRVEVVPEAEIFTLSNRYEFPEAPLKYTEAKPDLQRFVAKWGDSYGKGWHTTRVRQFNVDIPFDALDSYSFYTNNFSEFKNKIGQYPNNSNFSHGIGWIAQGVGKRLRRLLS